MAVHVELEIEIARPVEAVFEYLADGTNLPQWMAGFAEVEQRSSGEPGLGTTYQFRFTRPAMTSELRWIEFERDHRLAWDAPPAAPGAPSPAGSLQLDTVPGGTRVRVIYAPELGGPLRFAAGFFTRSIRKTRSQDLQRLKAILEADGTA